MQIQNSISIIWEKITYNLTAEASATALSSGITMETESADQTTFQWVHEKTIFAGGSPS